MVTGPAVGRDEVLFSAGGASEPAGAFRMSLEVRDETPVTAHPAHVAADPPVCADAVTSFSAIEPFNYINITSFEITENLHFSEQFLQDKGQHMLYLFQLV